MEAFQKSYLTRIIFPSHLNNNHHLFGGILMKWIDEIAYISALRFFKTRTVTNSIENIKFLMPIAQGDILELQSQIIEVGSVLITVQVDVWCEKPYSHEKELAASGLLHFVQVDENNNPLPIR